MLKSLLDSPAFNSGKKIYFYVPPLWMVKKFLVALRAMSALRVGPMIEGCSRLLMKCPNFVDLGWPISFFTCYHISHG